MDSINADMRLAEQALRSMDLLCGIFPKFWKKSAGFKEDDAVWGEQKVMTPQHRSFPMNNNPLYIIFYIDLEWVGCLITKKKFESLLGPGCISNDRREDSVQLLKN